MCVHTFGTTLGQLGGTHWVYSCITWLGIALCSEIGRHRSVLANYIALIISDVCAYGHSQWEDQLLLYLPRMAALSLGVPSPGLHRPRHRRQSGHLSYSSRLLCVFAGASPALPISAYLSSAHAYTHTHTNALRRRLTHIHTQKRTPSRSRTHAHTYTHTHTYHTSIHSFTHTRTHARARVLTHTYSRSRTHGN
jgi:hypothetical protein